MTRSTRRLLAAHGVVALVTTWVAAGRDLRAAPLSIATGRTATFDALVGYGTAISPPWPVASLLWRLRPATLAFAAVAVVVGQLCEPIVWSRRTWRDPVLASSILCNLILPIAIVRSARNEVGTLGT